jgi:hypothetical protein
MCRPGLVSGQQTAARLLIVTRGGPFDYATTTTTTM